MRKRQRKKNEKKYLTVMMDEFPLIMMTDEERKKAYDGYVAFRKRYAFRKKYKDLRQRKYLVYLPPMGRAMQETLTKIAQVGRHRGDKE